MNIKKQILFVTSQNTPTGARLVENLLQTLTDHHVHLAFEIRPRSFRSIIGNQWKNLKRNGLLWIPYRILAALIDKFHKWKMTFSRTPAPKGLLELCPEIELKFPHRFSWEVLENFHGKEFLKQCAERNYEIGVVFGTRILRAPLFSLPRHGMLNIHQGLIPQYRGMPPAFWEMFNDEKITGVTIHEVTSELDAGNIIFQQSLEISPCDSLRDVQDRLNSLSVTVLPHAVQSVSLGNSTPYKPNLSEGKCYSQPTVIERLKFYWKKNY